MEITHGSKMSFEDANAKHRSSGIAFKYLSKGTEGMLENYLFVLARQESFYSPRHHHNFDQFRYAIKGDFSLAPNITLKEGQLAYHPEGVYYGPQDDGPEERVLLVLQCGGASKQGFMSLDQIRAANNELARVGKFEQGKYYANDATGPVDGYEASWSHIMGGKKLIYPKGRYNAPIIMDPDHFTYKKSEQYNVTRKLLGVFSEREIAAQMHKIKAPGFLNVGGDNAIHLLYVVAGDGEVGDEKVIQESTIRLLPGTECTLSTQTGIEVIHFVMPMLS